MLRPTTFLLAVVLSGCSELELVALPDAVSQSEDTASFCRPGDPKLDLLFVIDDSASMAREAVTLANALAGIGTFLGGPSTCPFELRVAVTTTSTCDGAAGSFLTTSCRERLADFVVPESSEGPAADVRDAACSNECDLASIDITPSLVEGSEAQAPRPWLRAGRFANLPDGIAFSEALACMVPAGLSGCTRETPLLALQAALARTRDPDDPQHGFLRADASLLVAIVTDEDEPDADVSSWVEMMRTIESEKRALDRESAVHVAVIGGVAVGYESGNIDGVDGCTAFGEVTPPTPNLVQFAAAFAEQDERTVSSSCSDDYTSVVTPVARILRDDLVPACLPFCLADGDPTTLELDPVCHAMRTEIVSNAGIVETIEEQLYPCLPDGAGSWLPPPGHRTCLDVVGDEEIDPVCDERGWNASYQTVSIAPATPAGQVCIEVTCLASLTPEIDCPDR